MATNEKNPGAQATSPGDWKEDLEGLGYQERNRIANIHMLKKPTWATGEPTPGIEGIDEVEYQHLGAVGAFWKSLISIPMLILLALPILLVLSFTLSRYGGIPESLTPHMFKAPLEHISEAHAMAAFWVLGIFAFVPWSMMVCRLESWVSGYLS